MTEAGLITARFAHYAALVLAFGAFAYAGYGARSASVGRSLAGLRLISSLLVLLAAGAVLAATVAGLGGDFASLSDPTLWSAVVDDTDFGRIWSVRILMASALVALGIATWRRPARNLLGLGVMITGGLVTTVALTGHAAVAEGTIGLMHRAADAAHLVAAAVWLGALLPLLMLLREGLSGSVEDASLAAARLEAFHAIGTASVAVLLLTGAVNSWYLVGSLERVVTTAYGGMLMAKLALFAGMLGLAADNRLRLVPSLAKSLAAGSNAGELLHRLQTRVRSELALGMIVLLAVAILGSMAPASA